VKPCFIWGPYYSLTIITTTGDQVLRDVMYDGHPDYEKGPWYEWQHPYPFWEFRTFPLKMISKH
jgi:hypothetical protein